MNQAIQRVAPAYLALLIWSTTSSASLYGPIMALYVRSLGIGPVEWGALASAWALGMFSMEWVWGNLADTGDRRRLMLLSALSMSVLFVLFTIHTLIPVFIVLELVAGMLGVAFGPMTRTYVSSGSPEKSIGLFASLWWASFMLGQVIGPVVGSFIAEITSFEYSFYASSVLSLVLAAFVLWSFPTDMRHREKTNQASILSGLKFVLNLRSARLLFFSALLVFVGRALVIAFLPLYASSIINMSTIQVGLLFAALSATELISMPALGWLSDRFGVKRTAVLSYVVSAFLFLLYFLAKTIYQVFLVSIALGVGLSGLFVLLALIPTVAPRGMYGKVIGVYGSFEDLGIMIGPLIFGFVWSAYGPVYIFAVAAFAQLLAGFFVLRIGKEKRQ